MIAPFSLMLYKDTFIPRKALFIPFCLTFSLFLLR